MIPEPLPVVCLAVGDALNDLYVTRLYNMLVRNVPVPFTLTCITDRPRNIPGDVATLDCSGWDHMVRAGMRPTTRKLRLFDEQAIPFTEFLYLDTSLVIRKDMGALLQDAFSRPQDLVISGGMSNPGYNSSVMRIRPAPLRFIYDSWLSGDVYEQIVPGDQDFIRGAVAAKGRESQVALFAPGQIVSYRLTRTLGHNDPDEARRRIEGATIVKFHGRDKPHQVLDPVYNLFKLRLRHLRRLREGAYDAAFFRNELRRHWR